VIEGGCVTFRSLEDKTDLLTPVFIRRARFLDDSGAAFVFCGG